MSPENKTIITSAIVSAIISAVTTIWTTNLNNEGSLEAKKIDINNIREERIERERSEQCKYLIESYNNQVEKTALYIKSHIIINSNEDANTDEIEKRYDNYINSLTNLKLSTDKLSTFLTQNEYDEYRKNSKMIFGMKPNDVFNSNITNAQLIVENIREKVRSCNERSYNLKN